MKKVLSALALFAVLCGLMTVSQPASAANAGGACTKIGSTTKSGSSTLVCTAVAKKKVWKVKSTPVTYTAANYPWASVCDFDRFAPEEWKSVQAYLNKYQSCDGAYGVVTSVLTAIRPVSQITDQSKLLDSQACKIRNQRTNGSVTGFTSGANFKSMHPGPNTKFQIIPVQTLDSAAPKGTPLEEYSKYVKFLKTTLVYISDGPSAVTFSSPNHYIKMDVKLADYGIGIHGAPTPKGNEFFESAVRAVDSEIDFSKSDYSLVVIPADSKPNLLGVQPYPRPMSAEGRIQNMLSLNPANSYKDPSNIEALGFMPLGVFHELYHGGAGFDDHYGDQKWKSGDGLGMGNWGLMSTMKSDLGGWEKWIAGFTLDSQIRCTDASVVSTHWIVPGGVKTTFPKLVVVPVSQSKAIVVESLRPAGLNYKIPKKSQGALVYTIDTSDLRHGYGYQLILPKGRTLEVESPLEPFVGARAPLKLHESVVVDGIQIKVVEAGVFGDVVSVSKAQ